MPSSVYHHLQTQVHVAYTATYASRAVREAATVTADDVGKLYLQTDTGDLYRLASQSGGVGTWKAVAPRGDTVKVVNATGGGDFASLSAALAAITDAASNKRYTILVFGIVSESEMVGAKSYVSVQGMAGAKLVVTLDSEAAAVQFGNGVVSSTWRGLEIEAAGAGAAEVLEFDATTDETIWVEDMRLTTAGAFEAVDVNSTGTPVLVNVVTTLGDAGYGNDVSGYLATAHGDENTASGDYSLAVGRFAVASVSGESALGGGHTLNGGRRGELERREFVLGATTTNDTPTEMLAHEDERLALPNHAAWTFEALITGMRADAIATVGGYRVAGVIRRDATAGSTAMVAAATVTVLGEDDASWDVAAAADTVNGALKLTVTGKAAQTVKWGAVVRAIQVLKVV